jgi:Ran GTPase-activating protein (RanGAP) involved in mRNA processing and transport
LFFAIQPDSLNNGLKRLIGALVVKNILKHPDCEHWNLSGFCLQDDDVKELLDALIEGKFTRLKTINLYSNDLSDVSAERIARALKTNRTVTKVLLVSTPNLFVAANGDDT